LRIPLLRGFYIRRKEELLKQDRVQTVPPVKRGERKKICVRGEKENASRTMHQCEGSGFFGKGSPS
jgi:ribosomal protein S6E (S10)